MGRIWDIYWISKFPILLLFWRENKGRVIYQLSRQNNSNRGN